MGTQEEGTGLATMDRRDSTTITFTGTATMGAATGTEGTETGELEQCSLSYSLLI